MKTQMALSFAVHGYSPTDTLYKPDEAGKKEQKMT